MYDFAYRIADDPEGLHAEAKARMNATIERNKRMFDAGVESFILCSDYCYNSGPFLSPVMFGEFITPYLAGIIDAIRGMGGYAIKHTDGNIMPILDQLISCRPHAIHSIDPMAGVDIAEVKKITAAAGVAICGNVNCALMQTGTDDEVRASAMYALTHGKPGGGYIYCTSNVPFRGMPVERYQMILDIWREHRDY
jgi:uroporphyrinogen decarboxylase